MLMLAKQELHSAQYATYKSTQIKNAAVSLKNEVMEILERELQNESRQHNRQQGRTKRRKEEI